MLEKYSSDFFFKEDRVPRYVDTTIRCISFVWMMKTWVCLACFSFVHNDPLRMAIYELLCTEKLSSYNVNFFCIPNVRENKRYQQGRRTYGCSGCTCTHSFPDPPRNYTYKSNSFSAPPRRCTYTKGRIIC